MTTVTTPPADDRRIEQRFVRTALVCFVLSVALHWLIPLVFGTSHPIIRVAWRELSGPARRYLEQRFDLIDPRPVPDGSWTYVARDTSGANLRTLLDHQSVAHVVGIDRETFRVSNIAPRTGRRGGLVDRAPAVIPRLLDRLASGLVLLGVLAAGLAAAARRQVLRSDHVPRLQVHLRRRLSLVRECPAGVLRWLQRGIPIASAESAGLFRIVFGAIVVALALAEPVSIAAMPPNQVRLAEGAYGAIVTWLADRPSVVDSLHRIMKWSGLLFIAGMLTRASFATFVIAFLLWSCVFTLRGGLHAVSVLQVTLICLVGASWGDAWSVDAWIRKRNGWQGADAPGRRYGYTFWVPGLALGVALSAAAWAKLRDGLDWVANGTVKYHFVSDLSTAWVDWGPTLTRYHLAAVALSGLGVLIEALFITVAFSRSQRYRLVLIVACLMLFTGFALFQGVFWPFWWVLFVSFLPWHRIDGSCAAAARHAPVTVVQMAAIVALVAQQVWVSANHLEARPLLSSYDMYSTTYGSIEQYEAATNLVYRVVAVTDAGSADLPGCVVDDQTAVVFRLAAAGGSREREHMREELRRCLGDRKDVRLVALEGDRRVYKWDQGRFEWKRRVDVIEPVDAGWLVERQQSGGTRGARTR